MHYEPTEYSFRSRSYNAGRTFKAATWGTAAAIVADSLARKAGGRRAGAWTLHHESSSPDYTTRHYTSTAAIPTKQPGEGQGAGEHGIASHSAGGAAWAGTLPPGQSAKRVALVAIVGCATKSPISPPPASLGAA